MRHSPEMRISEEVHDGYGFFDSKPHPSHVLVDLPKVEAAFPLQRVLIGVITPRKRAESQGAIVCHLVADDGFSDELLTRVLVPFGDRHILGRPMVPQEPLGVLRRVGRCRHVVPASSLPVAPYVQRKCPLAAAEDLVGSHDAGSQLLLGLGVTLDEHPVPYVDPRVHRPDSGIVVPCETALCYSEGLPHLVDEGS